MTVNLNQIDKNGSFFKSVGDMACYFLLNHDGCQLYSKMGLPSPALYSKEEVLKWKEEITQIIERDCDLESHKVWDALKSLDDTCKEIFTCIGE